MYIHVAWDEVRACMELVVNTGLSAPVQYLKYRRSFSNLTHLYMYIDSATVHAF